MGFEYQTGRIRRKPMSLLSASWDEHPCRQIAYVLLLFH